MSGYYWTFTKWKNFKSCEQVDNLSILPAGKSHPFSLRFSLQNSLYKSYSLLSGLNSFNIYFLCGVSQNWTLFLKYEASDDHTVRQLNPVRLLNISRSSESNHIPKIIEPGQSASRLYKQVWQMFFEGHGGYSLIL